MVVTTAATQRNQRIPRGPRFGARAPFRFGGGGSRSAGRTTFRTIGAMMPNNSSAARCTCGSYRPIGAAGWILWVSDWILPGGAGSSSPITNPTAASWSSPRDVPRSLPASFQLMIDQEYPGLVSGSSSLYASATAASCASVVMWGSRIGGAANQAIATTFLVGPKPKCGAADFICDVIGRKVRVNAFGHANAGVTKLFGNDAHRHAPRGEVRGVSVTQNMKVCRRAYPSPLAS